MILPTNKAPLPPGRAPTPPARGRGFAFAIASGSSLAAAALSTAGIAIAALSALRGTTSTVAAALLLCCATGIDAARVARSLSPRAADDRPPSSTPRPMRLLRTWAARVPAGFGPAAALLLPLAGAALLVADGYASASTLALPRTTEIIAALLCSSLAFALLVFERHLAARAEADRPEAPALRQIARVAITVTVGAGAALALPPAAGGMRHALFLAAQGLIAAVTLEMALHVLLSLFVRQARGQAPRLLAPSIVANLLQWPPRPIADLGDSLRERFGIDLRQTWAFAHIRRALPRTLLVTLGLGWILSGVREIPSDQRAVHERFGEPVAVWGPGLHLGLPWPFSRLRYVDYGTIRTVAIGSADEGKRPAPSDTAAADGLAPAAAHRLWDVDHVSEKSQVIAREAGARQSFEVVYMDVGFVYRIGLSDEAALASAYRVAELPALIRSAAGRVLVRDFSTRTLEGVLGERRETLAGQIRQRVQAELDALGGGVEILATLIEAVHPPAGAANAYHAVQAALIRADAAIARERGRSAEEANEAQLQAAMRRDKSTATAREGVAAAQAAQLRFDAERRANAAGGPAFLFEQYLAQLSKGLSAARLVVLDHRVDPATGGPLIDLRSFVPPAAAATP